MFLTEKKDIKEIDEALSRYKKIGIIGCASCASVCLTGGSKEVRDMEKHLEASGKEVTFTISIDEPCDKRVLKEDIRFVEDEMEDTEAVVVLSCGTGVQTIGEFIGKKAVAGTDSKYIAQTEHIVNGIIFLPRGFMRITAISDIGSVPMMLALISLYFKKLT